MQWVFILGFAAIVFPIAFRRDIAAWLRGRRNRRKFSADNAAWRVRFEAENTDTSPLTAEEIDAFRAWHTGLGDIPIKGIPIFGEQ